MALAIVVQMPASHPILPDDRKHREIATRHASRQRRVAFVALSAPMTFRVTTPRSPRAVSMVFPQRVYSM